MKSSASEEVRALNRWAGGALQVSRSKLLGANGRPLVQDAYRTMLFGGVGMPAPSRPGYTHLESGLTTVPAWLLVHAARIAVASVDELLSLAYQRLELADAQLIGRTASETPAPSSRKKDRIRELTEQLRQELAGPADEDEEEVETNIRRSNG